VKSCIRELIAMCHRLAADPRRVVAGGGNASVKDGDTMYIKASGAAMSTLREREVVPVSVPAVLAVLERRDWPADRDEREAAVVEAMLAARVDPVPGGARPSVETVLHAALAWRYVLHVHPVDVNALGCSREGHGRAGAVLNAPGVRGVWMPYCDPGITLGARIHRVVAGLEAPPNVLILANHGLLVGGETPAAVGRLVRRVERLSAHAAGIRRPRQRRPSKPERALARLVAPVVRGALEMPVTVLYDGRPALLALTADAEVGHLATAGPISPDQIVYAGVAPAWVDLPADPGAEETVAAVREALTRFERRRGRPPGIVLVRGVGAFAIGLTPGAARVARDVYWSVAETLLATRSLGGPRRLTRRQTRFIDTWGAETYRRSLVAGTPARSGRVEERVILITGAGQGVGEGLARGLAAEGAHVICADVQADAVERVADSICGEHGPDAAVAVTADCTSAEQMAAAVEAAVDAFGGLDVLISNAGILFAHKATEFPPDLWRRIIDVNLVGYFVSAQAAARVMALQRRGDIIQINSKSGKRGSRYNSAYAAGKFGGIGLTQSLALDLAEDGIRVNCICPGNFFELPLWQRPGGILDQYSAKHGGISREAVLKLYLDQVPLGRGARVGDVLKTVLYILEQTYETGQAYNVTGGQEMR